MGSWRQWREVALTAGAFAVALVVAWLVCKAIGQPDESADLWVVCVGFATAVAAAVGLAVHREAPSPDTASAGPTTVRGDGNRVVGAGASRNDLGDHVPSTRPPVPGEQPAPAEPGQPTQLSPASSENSPPAPGEVRVEGNRNRVVGPGGRDNRLGDGAGGSG
jgi:hypothetical protein